MTSETEKQFPVVPPTIRISKQIESLGMNHERGSSATKDSRGSLSENEGVCGPSPLPGSKLFRRGLSLKTQVDERHRSYDVRGSLAICLTAHSIPSRRPHWLRPSVAHSDTIKLTHGPLSSFCPPNFTQISPLPLSVSFPELFSLRLSLGVRSPPPLDP